MYGDRIRERTWRELCSGSLATRIHNGGPSGWARWAERADAQCGQLIETGTLLNDYNHLSITASAYINYSAKNTRANANSTFDPSGLPSEPPLQSTVACFAAETYN